jgi:hypothetical protein
MTSIYHFYSILIGIFVVSDAYCENVVQHNSTHPSVEIISRLHDLENKVKGLEAVLQKSKGSNFLTLLG